MRPSSQKRAGDETVQIPDLLQLPSGTNDPDETADSDVGLSTYFIRLLMPDQHTIRALPTEDALVIGRYGETSRDVNIDLNVFEGYNMGVSRYHAAIIPLGGQLLLHDLDSTNGTRLNGHKCRPKTAYPIRPGDIISIGRLNLKVLSVPQSRAKS